MQSNPSLEAPSSGARSGGSRAGQGAGCNAAARPRLCRVVAAEVGIPVEEVTLATQLGADLGLDSYDLLELLDSVEGAFGVTIRDEAVDGLTTVADLERVVRRARRARPRRRAPAPAGRSVASGSE